MRSLITGARAGINDLSSSSLALCQAELRGKHCLAAQREGRETTAGPGMALTLVKVHDSPLQRGGRSLGPIGDPQLAEQAVDVGLHRGLGDVQRGGNLFVAVPSHDQLQAPRFHARSGWGRSCAPPAVRRPGPGYGICRA